MEKTLLMVKPDGVQRGLIGEIVKRFEQKGFQMIAGKLMVISKDQAEFHYAEHRGKPFFNELVEFITSGPVFPMVWQADQIITLSRSMIGKTNISEATPGTLRGDFGLHMNRNLIHGSDAPESAEREINNLFTPEEITEYKQTIQAWT